MAIVKHKGIPKELGGVTYVIPPLPLGALEQLQAQGIALDDNINSPQQVTTVIDVAHIALRRNYPELTRDQVGELIDLGNMVEVFEAAMDVSGVLRKALEDAAQGESTGAQTP